VYRKGWHNFNRLRGRSDLPGVNARAWYRLRRKGQKYGLEGSQVVLGHSSANVTQIYAERDFELAKQIMSEVG
jgi:hypothetical protein